MPNNRRGLGRGLEGLIPTELPDDPEFDPIAKVSNQSEQVVNIAANDISPNPHQPRQQFDEAGLEDLATSIRQYGIIQPLIVTQTANGYELIAGERRLRAAKLAGLSEVPVIVRSIDDQSKLELALIENIQRSELNPIETAAAYRKLVDQFNLKLEDISKRVGRETSTVSNTMRLLGLPTEAKRALVEGRISEGHARAVLSQPNPKKQLELLSLIISRNLTVRQAETLARGLKPKGAATAAALGHLETQNQWTKRLGQTLGTVVSIARSAKGNRLIINYQDDTELERIARQLLGD
ncbi:MAG TPA: ParB/RepB/Spo0J family partition protein [Candidatus Saccharimonadales bacterium]|nr:ParB/RepB/Spo0J family partition protein [Candidatus Saccharimonadales bacterium]